MSPEQANSRINTEMHIVRNELSLKTNIVMSKLKENRRYCKIVF